MQAFKGALLSRSRKQCKSKRPQLNGDDEYKIWEPDSGESLEQTRHNYTTQAQMDESDDRSVAGLIVNTSGHRTGDGVSGRRKAESASDFLLLHELSLSEFEDWMEGRYGEDFAENWAAELLDEESYMELVKIENQDERRERIANSIREGMTNGTIAPAKVKDIPHLEEWLNHHDQLEERRLAQAGLDTKDSGSHEHKSTDDLETKLSAILSSKP